MGDRPVTKRAGRRDSCIAFLAPAHDLVGMWRRPLRCLVSMFVAIAFPGGASVQAMPITGTALSGAVLAGATAMMPGCADMGMVHDGSGPAPNKGLSSDCLKLMQCLGIPSGPVAAADPEAPVGHAAVAYWMSGLRLRGVALSPTPFPPRQA